MSSCDHCHYSTNAWQGWDKINFKGEVYGAKKHCEFSCMQFCNNQKLPLNTERIKLLFSVSNGPHFCGDFLCDS